MDSLEVISNFFLSYTNSRYGPIFQILIVSFLIIVYGVFIFYFYRFLAKKNIIELNLNKYNKSSHEGLIKMFSIIFYILEYIIILPIITFFWFMVLSILIMVLSEGIGLDMVLLISAALIASVRVSSYINENLSQDMAKTLPFTLLGVALTKPRFFNLESQFLRIQEIPELLGSVFYFILVIIALEFIMRIYDLFSSFNYKSVFKDDGVVEEDGEEEKSND